MLAPVHCVQIHWSLVDIENEAAETHIETTISAHLLIPFRSAYQLTTVTANGSSLIVPAVSCTPRAGLSPVSGSTASAVALSASGS